MRKKQEKRIIRASLIFIGLFSVGAGVGLVTTYSPHSNTKMVRKSGTTKSKPQMSMSQSSSSSTLDTSSAQSSSASMSSAPIQSKETNIKKEEDVPNVQAADPAVTGTQSHSTGSTNADANSNFNKGGALDDTNKYIVQAGDNIWDISHKEGYDYETMVRSNPGINPDLIYRGQKLNIR